MHYIRPYSRGNLKLMLQADRRSDKVIENNLLLVKITYKTPANYFKKVVIR